ncbi:MAG: phosphate/phosphite/phosphonate ABC transporter substrate-binding protein [Betaproteobacteria bacterium]|nr:phosphate/phosphite/phosphonate ABC transporter substrate-binding protein [Betaproteobacteria bacterium]
MKLLCRALSIFLVLVAARAASASHAQRDEIVIGLTPEINIFQQMERFKPLSRYLSDQVGRTVRFRSLTRHGNIAEDFEQHHLDGAFFGSFTGALAIRKLGMVPIARLVELDGRSGYAGVIFVRKDSGIGNVAAMRGKRFAFVEKATSAGYLFPLTYLHAHGVKDADAFLGESYFAGSHDASVYAVLQGKASIGAAKDTVYDWVRAKEPRIDKELVVLARSGEFPSNGLGVRKDMDASLKAKLKSALLHLHDRPQGMQVLAALGSKRFAETMVEDYQPVFDAVGKAGIDIRKYAFRYD